MRDAIARHRQPVAAAEYPAKSDPAESRGLELPEPHATHQRNITFAFENRWRSLHAAKAAFESSVTHAEAVWGKTIRTAADPLLKCVNTLYHETGTYLAMFTDKQWHLSEDGKTTRAVVQSSISKRDEDKFLKKVEAAVSEIEAATKPHLKL